MIIAYFGGTDMKAQLKKNLIIFVVALVLSAIFALVLGWSKITFSDSLTVAGIMVMSYGAFVASNISNRMSRKERLSKSISPDIKEKKERTFTANLISGWITFAVGAAILGLSVLVLRL